MLGPSAAEAPRWHPPTAITEMAVVDPAGRRPVPSATDVAKTTSTGGPCQPLGALARRTCLLKEAACRRSPPPAGDGLLATKQSAGLDRSAQISTVGEVRRQCA